MARLNEPPPPAAESVDACKLHTINMRTKSRPLKEPPPADYEEVKRRFVRQNRELAKNNSTQSLRIRSLESEVSKLLADNLGLREQVLQLQHELYEAQDGVSGANFECIKRQLEEKILELGSLVNGLGSLRTGSEKRKRRQTDKTSLDQRVWKDRQPLSEVMREGQMPTITEDKLYPRQTLGAEEIRAIRLSDHSSNESPELGPPPVAHFDYAEPVKFDAPVPERPADAEATSGEADELPASLSVNLETRKKRKDGQPRLEIRRTSFLKQPAEESAPSPVKEQAQPVRTSAKRKLSAREADEPIRPPMKGDFSFSRRSTLSNPPIVEQLASASDRPAQVKRTDTNVQESSKEVATAEVKTVERRVLGDKSVNMSPRKTDARSGQSLTDEMKKPLGSRQDAGKDRATGRKPRVSSIPSERAGPEEIVKTVELPLDPPAAETLQPKTPAPPDLFSPTPSEPSTKPTGSRDTPPPSDLSSMSVGSDAARPSRRARGAVNYAEPSLNTKMRRPSKQLVGAVEGLAGHQRPVSGPAAREGSVIETGSKPSRTVFIKKEEPEEDAWKNLPVSSIPDTGSPLSRKETSEDRPAAHFQAPPGQGHEVPSASITAISGLIAGNRRRRESLQQPLSTGIEDATKKLDELDIYDFKESSSPASSAASVEPNPVAPSKNGRRHSSVPSRALIDQPAASSGLRRTASLAHAKADAMSKTAETATSGRSERAALRRRSMVL